MTMTMETNDLTTPEGFGSALQGAVADHIHDLLFSSGLAHPEDAIMAHSFTFSGFGKGVADLGAELVRYEALPYEHPDRLEYGHDTCVSLIPFAEALRLFDDENTAPLAMRFRALRDSLLGGQVL